MENSGSPRGLSLKALRWDDLGWKAWTRSVFLPLGLVPLPRNIQGTDEKHDL